MSMYCKDGSEWMKDRNFSWCESLFKTRLRGGSYLEIVRRLQPECILAGSIYLSISIRSGPFTVPLILKLREKHIK